MFREDDQAGELEHAEEVGLLTFPTADQLAEVVKRKLSARVGQRERGPHESFSLVSPYSSVSKPRGDSPLIMGKGIPVPGRGRTRPCVCRCAGLRGRPTLFQEGRKPVRGCLTALRALQFRAPAQEPPHHSRDGRRACLIACGRLRNWWSNVAVVADGEAKQ